MAAPAPSPPSGTVAFFATDVEGSTRRWEAMPQATAAAIRRHDAILRAAIEAHGGYVFKTVGDAFDATFAHVADAVSAAVDAQRALAAESWPEPGPIKVRMAIHAGAADEERDFDYFGRPVNRLARLLSVGHGGQVLLSQAVQLLVRDHLPDGIGLRDLGEHRLRDLLEPERVFQLVGRGLPTEFPRLKTVPLSWPRPGTRLIGREEDVKNVRASIDERRLVTLIGPPGVGKTRLALEAAEEVIAGFRDGAVFVDLSALVDPSLVAATIARVVGATETGGRLPEESLLSHLRSQTMLLVLDNFEQVLPAAATVSRLLRECPGIKVVVTSREPLNLIEHGEQRYLVEPLAASSQGATSIDKLRILPAVELFVDEARRIDLRFALTSENAPAVASICQRLDGLPLAIRLAAAWTSSFSPHAILSRLERSLDLLEGGGVDLPERQRTMRGAVAWSYDLLSQDLGYQAMVRLSAVFRGPFFYAALAEVCAVEPRLMGKAARAIRALTEKGLLQRLPRERGEDLYDALAVIHEYADELLEQQPIEKREAQQRHALWYRGLAHQAAMESQLAQKGVYQQVEAEYDNLRQALEYYRKTDAGLDLLEMAVDLAGFWGLHGYFDEGQGWIQAGLRMASAASPTLKARALVLTGDLVVELGDLDEAERLYREALLLHRELGNRKGEADALADLGVVAIDWGNLDQAESVSEEALQLYREQGDRTGEAHALRQLGIVAMDRGNLDEAERLYGEALQMFRSLRNYEGEAKALRSLGVVLIDRGDLDEAERLSEEALQLFGEQGDRTGEANALTNLGNVAIGRGDLDEAGRLSGEALRLYREVNIRAGEADALRSLANVAIGRGDLEEAERLSREALRLYRELGDRTGEAKALRSLDNVAIARIGRDE